MAITQFLTANVLLKRSKAPNPRHQFIVLCVGTLFSIACFILTNPWYGFIGLVLTGLFSTLVPIDPDTRAKYLAGAEGEEYALSLLKQLPDSFTIFNQIHLPNRRSSIGTNEADLIVCGPKAIFVIEVKHNTGSIICNEQHTQWQISKTGRKGTGYTTQMRNPISQVKLLSWLLSEYLKKNDVKPWVQGLVLFTHPKVNLTGLNAATSLPVIQPHQLLSYIQSFQAKTIPKALTISRTVNAITYLR
jgi:hypothetical protein